MIMTAIAQETLMMEAKWVLETLREYFFADHDFNGLAIYPSSIGIMMHDREYNDGKAYLAFSRNYKNPMISDFSFQTSSSYSVEDCEGIAKIVGSMDPRCFITTHDGFPYIMYN